MIKQCFALFIFTSTSFLSHSQEGSAEMYVPDVFQKELSGYFGWNRSHYSNSDISFTGADYDFVLNNVKATDRQSAFSVKKYFGLKTLSIPQTNYSIRYRFSEKAMFTFCVDHMKYVVSQGQKTTISGSIGSEYENYAGEYDNDNITIDADFLQFEHTDGLNYVNFGYLRIQRLLNIRRFAQLDWNYGGAMGFLLPKTNSRLLGNEKHDEYHLAGFGIDASTGLQLNIGSVFFLASHLKAGVISMPSIRTTADTADKASQSFSFLQGNFVFGFRVKL